MSDRNQRRDWEVRIGVIGAGANTRRRHLPGFQAIPGVRVLGVVNRTEASSRAVAEEFGIPRIYRHWQEAIEDPATNAIVIGTWPCLHAPATLAALAAGKHVLTEARMAMNAAEARTMLAASRARPDLVAQVVPAPFSLEVDRTVSRLIDEGRLGDVLAIEHREAGSFPDPEAPITWRQDRRRSGLNIMMLGVVYEMLLRWVGPAVRVMATGRVVVSRRRDADGHLAEVSIPDHVEVLADMACGAVLHLRQTAVAAVREGTGTWLYGSDGVLCFRNGGLAFAGRGDSALTPVEIPPEERGSWRVEAEFIGAVRGEEPVRLTTFEDGVRYMEFTEAVWRSWSGGCAVSLPLPADLPSDIAPPCA